MHLRERERERGIARSFDHDSSERHHAGDPKELTLLLYDCDCSRRTLVSIGTHDLDSIEGPFSYEAKPPSDIRFVPLDKTEEVDGHGVMTLYEVAHRSESIVSLSHSTRTFSRSISMCGTVAIHVALASARVSRYHSLGAAVPGDLRCQGPCVESAADHQRRSLEDHAQHQERLHRGHGNRPHQGPHGAQYHVRHVLGILRHAVHVRSSISSRDREIHQLLLLLRF